MRQLHFHSDLQVVKDGCFIFQVFHHFLIVAHALGDIFHIGGQVHGIARHAGDFSFCEPPSFGLGSL